MYISATSLKGVNELDILSCHVKTQDIRIRLRLYLIVIELKLGIKQKINLSDWNTN